MRTKQYTTKSGEVLTLMPVGQVELAPFAEKIEPFMPKPPIQIIQTSQGPKEVPNETHPAYLAAAEKFAKKYGMFTIATFIELGVDLELTDEQQEQVEKRRKKRERINPGAPENQFDIYIYVSMLCDEAEELSKIAMEITSLNNPTAQQVQRQLDSFRPDLQGASNHEDKDAPQWNRLAEPELTLDPLQSSEVGEDRPGSFLRRVGPRVAG